MSPLRSKPSGKNMLIKNYSNNNFLFKKFPFKIVLVSSATPYSGRGSYTINLYREFKEMNLDVELIWVQNPERILKHLIPLPRLLRILSKNHFIVHFLSEGVSLTAPFLQFSSRVLVTIHDIPNYLHLKVLNNFVDAFITVGLKEYITLRHLKSVRKNVYYIPLGVSHKIFKPTNKKWSRAIMHIDPNAIVLLTTNDDPRIRADKVVEVVHCLQRKYKLNVKLLVLGRPVDYLLRKIRELELNSDVRFIYEIPLSSLVHVYNSADLMLYLSTFDAFALPVIEAISCGTPVLSTPVGIAPLVMKGLEELLISKNAGTEEICDRVYKILRSRDVLKTYSEILRRRASRYSWRLTALRTLRVYLKTLEHKSILGNNA